MLHILLMILKILLMILAVILGIVLIVILCVLFCPVRYRVAAEKRMDQSLQESAATVKVGWLAWGISLQISYQNGSIQNQIKILGISLEKIKNIIKNLKTKKKNKTTQKEVASVKKQKTSVSKKNTNLSKKQQPAKISEKRKTVPQKTIASVDKKEEAVSEQKKDNPLLKKIKDILKLPKELKNKFQGILLKIKKVCSKIEWWKNFLGNPRVQEWIGMVKDKLIQILKHIFPTKAKGSIVFGSEDPYITGTVLALLGMTIPVHKNAVTVIPVFENGNILEGNVKIRGRIYGIFLIIMIVKILLDKNTKYMIRRWKNKEE